MKNSKLKVEVFKGNEASVNSYLFSNETSVIVMDTLRNSEEAKSLADYIKNLNLPLTHILISHGHPDHYIGMQVLNKSFPEAKIIVASEEIKEDIISFSTYMNSIGWLDNEPFLKPKSEEYPEGFDYQNSISVYNEKELTLEGGGTLQISTDYKAAEAAHLTTLYSDDLNAFFTSDFCYNNVHLWLGTGVEKQHIENWLEELNTFKNKFKNSPITLYPGHGEKSDITLIDKVTKYINDFKETILNYDTEKEAINKMKTLYPNWSQADFLLQHSVKNHLNLKNNR